MHQIYTKPTPKERALEVHGSKHKTIESKILELCGKSNMNSQHEWTITPCNYAVRFKFTREGARNTQ